MKIFMPFIIIDMTDPVIKYIFLRFLSLFNSTSPYHHD